MKLSIKDLLHLHPGLVAAHGNDSIYAIQELAIHAERLEKVLMKTSKSWRGRQECEFHHNTGCECWMPKEIKSYRETIKLIESGNHADKVIPTGETL